jgi:hypothetical protein
MTLTMSNLLLSSTEETLVTQDKADVNGEDEYAPDPQLLGVPGLQPSVKAVASPKFKKAPDAPKRFKSAFIIFSAEKHKEIKGELTKLGKTEKVRDLV